MVRGSRRELAELSGDGHGAEPRAGIDGRRGGPVRRRGAVLEVGRGRASAKDAVGRYMQRDSLIEQKILTAR